MSNVSQLRRTEGTKEAATPEFSGKYPVHLLRVAALIHLLYKDNEVIDEDDINQAVILLREVQEEHLYYFSDFNPQQKLEKDAEEVLGWIKRQTGYQCTVQSVNKNGPICARNRELLQQQLDFLVSKNEITVSQSGKSLFINLNACSRASRLSRVKLF